MKRIYRNFITGNYQQLYVRYKCAQHFPYLLPNK